MFLSCTRCISKMLKWGYHIKPLRYRTFPLSQTVLLDHTSLESKVNLK